MNKGKERECDTEMGTEARIVSLYREKYDGISFSNFTEKLNEEEDIKYTYRTMHRIHQIAEETMGRQGERQPPSRPSRQQFGNPLKLDASICNQFDPSLPKAALHGVVDDATGTVMSLWFERKETPRGDYEMMWQILDKYGITESLHDDRKPIFISKRFQRRKKRWTGTPTLV